jgi:hypothetical protein
MDSEPRFETGTAHVVIEGLYSFTLLETATASRSGAAIVDHGWDRTISAK